jgi:hypothetical protein
LTRGQRAHHPQRCRQATQAWLSRARNTWRRRLGAGTVLPPLPLDDEEAVAVAVGLRTATGGTVTGIEETSLRALAKLEQVLPTRLRGRSTPCTPTLSPRRRVVHQSAVFLAGGVLEDELDRDGYGKANERVDPVPAEPGSGDPKDDGQQGETWCGRTDLRRPVLRSLYGDRRRSGSG